MNESKMPHQVPRVPLLSVASVGVFLLAVSEMIFMTSPFAAYFYSVYSPVLSLTQKHSYSIWLAEFFVLHLSTPSTTWLEWFLMFPRYLVLIGLASFVIHAAYLYWTKFVRKTVATALLYRYIRHPQYTSFAVAGLGLVFLWPRFINLLLFLVMLIGYYALARNEEERVQHQHGEQYVLYKQRTGMFLPGNLGGRMVEATLGWLPYPSIHGYVALIVLLLASLAGSFYVRGAFVRNLHYVVQSRALVVFLNGPAGVNQSETIGEITRLSANQPPRVASVPLFYVVSKKDSLHHLLIDSGIERDAVTQSKIPNASWYLVEASAGFC